MTTISRHHHREPRAGDEVEPTAPLRAARRRSIRSRRRPLRSSTERQGCRRRSRRYSPRWSARLPSSRSMKVMPTKSTAVTIIPVWKVKTSGIRAVSTAPPRHVLKRRDDHHDEELRHHADHPGRFFRTSAPSSRGWCSPPCGGSSAPRRFPQECPPSPHRRVGTTRPRAPPCTRARPRRPLMRPPMARPASIAATTIIGRFRPARRYWSAPPFPCWISFVAYQEIPYKTRMYATRMKSCIDIDLPPSEKEISQ